MAYTSLVEALAEQKRAAKLAGRPPTTNEVRGVTEGYFSTNAGNILRQRELQQNADLQTERLGSEKSLQEARLAQEYQIASEQLAAEKEAAKRAETMQFLDMGTSLATVAGPLIYDAWKTPAAAGTGAAAGSGGATKAGAAAGPAGMTWVEGVGWVATAYTAGKWWDKKLAKGSSEYPGGESEKNATITSGAAGGIYAGDALGPKYDEWFDEPDEKDITTGWGGGAFIDFVDDACIIVTACTDRNSYEVNVARAYRDAFMDRQSLGGYYAIARFVVPLIGKSSKVKATVKRLLVDRLIDFGEVALGIKPRRELFSSRIVSKSFLTLCRVAGFFVGYSATKALCHAHGNGR